ncbi:MAG: hypothetical protein MRERC_7c055 [Mycoplasmataceae bacterium RC_NB112A]|nr:MAG: hypothetical protein MRERC_8c055 [Mycoplasmataceae bacterium RC_NB112A]KLL01892.1 MAG: hypothetical protein MRERC_7c055 [Mycoplasmataceae bacterium RC_NB112A]
MNKIWKLIKKLFKEDEKQKNQIGDNNKFINSSVFQQNIEKIENYYSGWREKEFEEIKKQLASIAEKLPNKEKEEIKKSENSSDKKFYETIKKWPDDFYKVKETKEELKKLFPEIKTDDDRIGYELFLQGFLMLKFRESVVNIWDYLVEVDLKKMEERDLDGIKRTLVMIFNIFDAKLWKQRKEVINYCFKHIVKNCRQCENDEGISLWIIEDKPGIKEELIKADIWNIRLEARIDKGGKEKLNFWLVEKEDFEKKKLFQNKLFSSSIAGERNKMAVIKVSENDFYSRETIRKLQGINITQTILTDKKMAAESKGYEVWLLEKDRVGILWGNGSGIYQKK